MEPHLVWHLLLSVVCLGGALYRGRQTHWKHLNQIFGGIGTINPLP